MAIVTREMSLSGDTKERSKQLLEWEWLVTNGLGGYASGTLLGARMNPPGARLLL